MADYKELLRRAISALPENNGAARRAVYEKARSALVGQLRAIQPPLPARDITQHRLQLEDCIRQVEQEASEAIINLGRDHHAPPRTPPVTAAPAPRPTPIPEPAPLAARPPERIAAEPAAPVIVEEARPEPSVGPEQALAPVSTGDAKSIEEIIALAAETSGVTVAPAAPPQAAPPAVESRNPAPSPFEPRRAEPRPSPFPTRREPAVGTGAAMTAAAPALPRLEPSLGATALARQPAAEPVAIVPAPQVETALSAVREVEVEDSQAREAEDVIERAIETLDREARGEATEPLPDRELPPLGATEDPSFAAAEAETRSGAGLTIFLVVFALLLVGVGGAGFWAWREGYVDLDQMFGRSQPAVTETAQSQATEPALPNMDTAGNDGATTTEDGTAGPGNTATTTVAEPTTALQGLEVEDRLEPTPEAVTPNGSESVLPSLNGEAKTEERLSGADTSIAATDDPAASVDPTVLAGNQSLLLEAATSGQGGAVPFSGTVDWSEGVDEIGLPTLVGKASIPARNLGVSITIRKNSDPVLPASHLMEISFDVPDTFVGGSIATLAGVLLKDQELVPGTALAGAAARVVGNSFLFALSATPDDLAANIDLLDTRRWLDLAVIYGTGRNAILTLEKDDDAQALFDKVIAAWK